MNDFIYVNTETYEPELLTLNDLKNYYISFELNNIESDFTESGFNDYLNSCLTINNGSIKPVAHISGEYFRYYFNAGLISESAFNKLNSLKTDFYMTYDNHFYTNNGMYFYSIEDLNTIE